MSFVGLRLYDDENGQRRLIAYLKQGVVQLKPNRQDRSKPPGWYTMGWNPVDPRLGTDAFEESEHPRGQPKNAGQFVSKGGGGGGVGRAPEAELAKAMATAPVSVPPRSNAPEGQRGAEWLAKPLHGATFVSPNIAEHLDFPTSVAGLQSRRQRLLESASKEIDVALGLHSRDSPAIGAWSDGAENSLMTEVDGGTWEQLVAAAAMKASLADQKAALVFQEAPNGKELLYSFPATGSLHDIHAHLLEDGVEFHTIVPTHNGAMVYVADLDGKAHDAVDKAAERYGAVPAFYRGHGAFVPADADQKHDGTDREQRTHSRREYDRIIASSGVEGSAALWQRIHNAYRQKIDAAYQVGVAATGEAGARYATKQWASLYDADTGEKLIKDAERNQPELVSVAKQVADKVGAEAMDPGVKGIKRIKEKIEGGKKPWEISDVTRLGFKVRLPDQADAIVRDLAKVFEVADEGWRHTKEGYFDRTLKLRFPSGNGQIGEVQIYPPGLFEAKKVGHKLYEEFRSSKDEARRRVLAQQMSELYGGVIAKMPDQWKQVLQH